MNDKIISSLIKENIENIGDLSKKCEASLGALKNLYKNENISVDELKSKTESIFEDLKQLINSKEKEVLSVFSNIGILKDFLRKEMLSISKKIEEIFTQEQLSTLKSEEDILNFFVKSEEELKEFLSKSYKRNSYLKYYLFMELEDIFKNNSLICNITKDIDNKKKGIAAQAKSEKEFIEKLPTTFPNVKIPEFLIYSDLKDVQYKSYLTERKANENNALIEVYEKIGKNEINVLDGINNKKELLFLFIAVNNKTFHRTYFGDPYLSIFRFNEHSLKQYFGEGINYNEIHTKFSTMNEDQEKIETENLLKIIDNEVNGNSDKLFNIIASFYYILYFQFKDPKKYNDLSNIGNTYINLIFKNFVIFLDSKFNTKIKLNKNLLELLNELYLLDINYLNSRDLISIENKSYSYLEIGKTLLSKNTTKDIYINLDSEFLMLDDPLAMIKKNIYKHLNPDKYEIFDENIHLIPLNKNVNSNTVTIIIDGFGDEVNKKDKNKTNIIHQNRINQWKDLVDYFKNETNIYFFQWALNSQESLFKNIEKKKVSKDDVIYVKDRAKLCGKLLAYILLSNQFFNNFQVSFIGFSFGNKVIKNCLKELDMFNKYNRFFILKNVILIGAYNHMRNKETWKKYIEGIIVDKFINCYSTVDEVLKVLSVVMKKNGLCAGNDALIINNNKGANLVLNYDFTLNKFDQLSYKFGLIIHKIFHNYRDI